MPLFFVMYLYISTLPFPAAPAAAHAAKIQHTPDIHFTVCSDYISKNIIRQYYSQNIYYYVPANALTQYMHTDTKM